MFKMMTTAQACALVLIISIRSTRADGSTKLSLDVARFSNVEHVLKDEQQKFAILKEKEQLAEKEYQNANPNDFKFTKQQQDAMKAAGITEKMQNVLQEQGLTSVGAFAGITETDLNDAGIPSPPAQNLLKVKSQFMDAREQAQAVTSEIVEATKIAIKNIEVRVNPTLAMMENAKQLIEVRIKTVNQHIDQSKQKQVHIQKDLSKTTSDKTKAETSLAGSNTKVSHIEKEIKDVKQEVAREQKEIKSKQKTIKDLKTASIATGVTGGVLAIFTFGASAAAAAAAAATSAATIASLEIAKAVIDGKKHTLEKRLKQKQGELRKFNSQCDKARKDVKRFTTSISGLQKDEAEQKKELNRLQAVHTTAFATLTSTEDLRSMVEQLTTDVSYYSKTVLNHGEFNGKFEVPYDEWISRVHHMFDLATNYNQLQLGA